MKRIFLSYARIDNDKDEQDEKQGWVAYVHSRLRLALNPKLGKRLDFWRDVQEIQRGEAWHEQIKSALNEARVLLAILSPSFLESDNCRFELQHFLDCHKGSDPKRLAESVIKIVKHQIDGTSLPVEIREPEAFQLFFNDAAKGELSYYNPSTGLRADRQQEFMDELERVANRLVALLKDSGDVPVIPPSLSVFLAVPHPESTERALYERIKAELERRKAAVIPDRSRFFSDLDEPDRIVVDQAVTNARLAVHLLDPSASGKALALNRLQIDATDRRVRDGRLRRLIWVKRDTTGAAHNDLVTSLRRLHAGGGRLFESDSLVEESSERFIELLLRTLFPTESAPTTVDAAKVCYLHVAMEDAVRARQHALRELEALGVRARLPMPAELAHGDRVAIYWGSRDAQWVFGALNQLGTRSIILIKGPPNTPEKSAFFAGEVSETIDLTHLLPETA